MPALIHPTAVIHPDAVLGEGVEVGPHAVIGRGAGLGDGCYVGPSSVIEHVEMGRGNHISSHVRIGGEPQVVPRPADARRVLIGDGNTFREGVTVSRGTRGDTVIGSGCYFMANSHVGHDCTVGDRVTLVNGALLGGHVEVGDGAILSGNAVVHQFARIGTLALLSGLSAAVTDILPYCIAAGPRARLAGLNLVGLRRAKIPSDRIRELKAAYKTLFFSNMLFREALALLANKNPGPEVRVIVEFCEGSRRAIARPRRRTGGEVEEGH
ncbi:MAG: acyl-ACP--UDP-N-acetylglucosamine O-acyltransferase [Polyangiaceae bacterium]|nr:acyl-ACP--UDP-N-acetylglucosamine O-acyltransferase [Polyangiaceae bacterium]